MIYAGLHKQWDFPGGPVVKNPASKHGSQAGYLVRELGCHMPQGKWAHVPQLQSLGMPQQKVLHGTAEAWHSQMQE